MKYYLCLLSIIILLSTPSNNLAQENQPKIGLVLSGGGARGFAHIGTLKLIDSLQIPIDYIVGTSMGGIIGGLYASGYTGNEIEKQVLSSNWIEILGDELPRSETPYLEKKDDGAFLIELGIEGLKPVLPSGFVSGQLASLLLSDLTSGVGTIRNFDNLPIPFRCVAVDLVTGSEVVLQNGSLAKAMRATMSLPSIFSPVEWGDSLLIDGGMLNNFPSDVLKEMGADIIIGVNIGSQLAPKEELNNLVDILSQTMVLTDFAKQRRNYELCDLIITPDLGDFTTMDFDNEKVKNIIQIGINAASKSKNQLIELKQKYVYDLSGENSIEYIESTEQIISAITISGETSYNLEYLYELIGHSPNDTLNIIMLKDNISKMKTSGLFKKVDYKIHRITKNSLTLNFKLVEKKQPLIFGFTIIGNENLGFDFIIDLLAMKAGDPFDKQHLNEQIKYMSGLGYFEIITYIIEPVRDNYLRVVLTVKEKPIRKFRFGFKYDDQYKFVGFLGFQITNFPFVGLREELLIQFAGLVKFDYSVLYPSQTLDLPVFPYARIAYKNIPLDIYNLDGDKWAEYNDESWTFGVGIGHIFNNIGAIRLEYNHEYTNMDPELVGLDTTFFRTWKDELHVLHADLSLDLLDDPVLPRSGLLLEANYDLSLKNLGSDLKYGYFSIDGKLIKTLDRDHSFILSGFYTDSFNELPKYKWSIKGGANSFVGMKNNQVIGTNFGYLRFDYRYEFVNNVFVKLVANAGVYNLVDIITVEDNFYGYGLGISINTVIGPFELLFSRGSKSAAIPDEFQSVVYFNAGFSF